MIRSQIHRFAVNACSIFMLFFLPMLFRDAFFDINRVKVESVCIVCPILYFAAFAIGKKKITGILHPASSCFLMLLLGSAVLSFVSSGLNPSVLTGAAGRNCGLFFLLSCGAAFFAMQSHAAYTGLSAWLAMISAVQVAILGILHTAGIDPLGFYDRIQRGQETVFLSTIGNIDFFGAYLAMLLPFSMGFAVFSSSLSARLLCFSASMILMAGIACARTDIAFAAMQVSFLFLFSLSADTWDRIGRVLLLWAFSWLMLPFIRAYMLYSRFTMDYSVILLTLCKTRTAYVIGTLLLLGSILAFMANKSWKPAPGRRRTLLAFGILAVLAAAAILVAMLLGTFVIPQSDTVPDLLRMNDAWGSRRGFVYRCCANALKDYSALQWLFGKGLDTTQAILTPYFDDPQMLRYGVFNDAHCQPLQMLLTCGILGLLSFSGFYISMLKTTVVNCKDDPILCGASAFLAGYAIIMLLSVTQPIIVAMYFSLCALTCSRINHSHSKEACHES